MARAGLLGLLVLLGFGDWFGLFGGLRAGSHGGSRGGAAAAARAWRRRGYDSVRFGVFLGATIRRAEKLEK